MNKRFVITLFGVSCYILGVVITASVIQTNNWYLVFTSGLAGILISHTARQIAEGQEN